MSVIKKVYDRDGLSAEKKAELKRALSESFPQYASKETGRTEVVIMEKGRITDTGGRAKVRSKFKTGIAAVAAAALIVTVGISAVRNMDVAKPSSAGSQTGYINDKDSPYYSQAKTIYNSMAITLADFEVNGYSYNHLVEREGFEITRDDILEVRSATIVHLEGELHDDEFVDCLDKNAMREGIDLGEVDFRIDFSQWSYNMVYYVFVYPDESHASFYSYPEYFEEPQYINDPNSPYQQQAHTIYNAMCEIAADYETRGIRFDPECSVIDRDTVDKAAMMDIVTAAEGDFASVWEIASVMEQKLREFELGEADFEAYIDTDTMTPRYVLVYPDKLHSVFYSYPRYDQLPENIADGGGESGYIDDNGSIYWEQANDIGNCIVKVELESIGEGDIPYIEDGMIDRDMVLKSRNVRVVHEEGRLNALELAMRLDTAAADMGFDVGEIDFEAYFDLDTMWIKYVFVYPDESHETFYCEPPYIQNPDVEEVYYEFTYSEEDAKALYEDAAELYKLHADAGDVVEAKTIDRREILLNALNGNKPSVDSKDGIVEGVEFFNVLQGISSIQQQISKGPYNFIIEFATEDGEIATGVKSATVEFPNKGLSFTYPREDTAVIVPDVANLPQKDAEQALRDAGLDVMLRSRYDEDVPAGAAISTEPSAGTEVAAGSNVTLYISKGAMDTDITITLPMPDGMNGSYTVDIVRDGEVIKTQYIKDGAAVAGDVFHIDISGSGKETLTVSITNDSSGKSVEYAVFDVNYDNKTAELNGSLDKDGLIGITSDKGTVVVPNVVGMKYIHAKNLLMDTGLKIKLHSVFDQTAEDGTILRQSIGAGSKVDPGTEITLTIASDKMTDSPIPID